MPIDFQLKPFTDHPGLPAIDGYCRRDKQTLILHFILQGDTSRISWPPPSQNPGRQMNLWEQTCFECFVAPDAATEYREFNYSPSGDWHSFMFPEYRAPLKPSDDTTLAVTDQVINPHEATFTLTLTFSHLKFSSTDWLISPAVVLLDIQGQHHYYALQHPASRPDFHLPTLRQLRLGYQ